MKLFWIIAAVAGALFFFFRPKTWGQKGWTEIPPPPGRDPPTVPGPGMLPESERIRDFTQPDELVTFVLDIGERVIDTGRDLPTGVAIATLGQTVIAENVPGLNQPLTVTQIGSGPISQIIFHLGDLFGPEVALTEGSVVQTQGWLGATPAILEITTNGFISLNATTFGLVTVDGQQFQVPRD